MKPRFLAFSLILIGFLQIGRPAPAASPPPELALESAPLPAGPLLKPLEKYSEWRTTYTYRDSNAKKTAAPAGENIPAAAGTEKPALRIQTVTITRTGPFWRAVTVDTQGGSMSQYSDGADEYTIEPGAQYPSLPINDSLGKRINKFAGTEREQIMQLDYSQTNFADMDWISPATYQGLDIRNTRTFMVFRKDDISVWIDLETRVPAEWRRGQVEMRSYQQLPTPAQDAIVFPESVRKLIAAQKRFQDAMKRPIR